MHEDTPLVSFDIDSTLADTGHRQGMIDRVNGTDWDAYSQACVDDIPVPGLVVLAQILKALGATVIAISARKSSALPHTVAWFQKHEIPIETVYLDETDVGDYDPNGGYTHMDYKVERIREVERLLGRKIALHIDDWAGVTDRLNSEGIPSICVRTPQEMEELVGKGGFGHV